MELWKLSAKFLVSRVKNIDTDEFLSFFKKFLKFLKFPGFTFNKPKGRSISASNTEANLVAFIMRMGSLKSCNTSGESQKFYDIQRGDHKKFN